MSRNLLLVALLALTGLAVAGCGQKGPLYLPDNDQAAKTYDPQGAHAEAQSGDAAARSDGAKAQPQPQPQPETRSQEPQAETMP
ncbi:lipoprotein [Salinicola sp. JS01]|uniref:LPS translocon maturation chaperone LptM n=1 Tax=Salinicola sp. JS01 TaxID=3050071 RepID=UPI00255BF7AC|nr:lipoprotein [Salinicola sp. JS01]WIX33033.1 lipoprotein [Salinicola sp. JS01]